jgi:hypothetical protein
MLYMPIPFVLGVGEWKIRNHAFTPLPRPGSSLIAQMGHESRRKARGVDLNT